MTFGLTTADEEHPEPVSPPSEDVVRKAGSRSLYEGLGGGIGGQIVRSCLVQAGTGVMDSARVRNIADIAEQTHSGRQFRTEFMPALATSRTIREANSPRGPCAAAAALAVGKRPPSAGRAAGDCRLRASDLDGDGGEPQGAFLALLLADPTPASDGLLKHVARHRWSFTGAAEMAARGRGYSYFVWCLLELQKNVQTQEDGNPLDAPLANACQAFVGTQTRKGRMSDMYQVLTHFICNSVVWPEWHKYLRASFEDPRANQEAFLVPRLEQVWSRFLRLRGSLETIFGVLDERFVWRHRLPKVGDLLLEHMRKRCFPLDLVSKNELFLQATIKDETLKQIKFAFGFS